MKQNFPLLLLLLLGFIVQAQPVYQVEHYGDINRKPESGTEFKAYGNIYHKINDTLYAALTEVINKDYKKFLSVQLQKEYEICRIDSSQWVKKFSYSYNYPMAANYHSHSAFDNYPVVNIAYTGAVSYCEWLTKKYRLTHKEPSVTFRLPTEAEWMALCNVNPATQLPWNIPNGKHGDTCYAANFKPVINGEVAHPADGGFYTVRVDSYWPDSAGLFNVIGNAAEMTAVEGISKGGSWENFLEDCRVNVVQTLTGPDPRVGFRVIAIVTERK